MGKAESCVENSPDNVPSLEEFKTNNDNTNDGDTDLFEDMDEENDGKDEDKSLCEEEQLSLLNNTSTVHETVSKV